MPHGCPARQVGIRQKAAVDLIEMPQFVDDQQRHQRLWQPGLEHDRVGVRGEEGPALEQGALEAEIGAAGDPQSGELPGDRRSRFKCAGDAGKALDLGIEHFGFRAQSEADPVPHQPPAARRPGDMRERAAEMREATCGIPSEQLAASGWHGGAFGRNTALVSRRRETGNPAGIRVGCKLGGPGSSHPKAVHVRAPSDHHPAARHSRHRALQGRRCPA